MLYAHAKYVATEIKNAFSTTEITYLPAKMGDVVPSIIFLSKK